jgi:hypothetical protein
MPKSIILFLWFAGLATAIRFASAGLDSQGEVFMAIYDTAMVTLRLAVIWLIVSRRSQLLRWGWTGFALIGAGANVIHFAAHPGDMMVMPGPLLIAYYGLMVASAVALLLPDSWNWFRNEPCTRSA